MDADPEAPDPMAWVSFSAAFDFHPTPRATIAYPAGYSGCVKRACADQAVAAGVAEEIPAQAARSAVAGQNTPSCVPEDQDGAVTA